MGKGPRLDEWEEPGEWREPVRKPLKLDPAIEGVLCALIGFGLFGLLYVLGTTLARITQTPATAVPICFLIGFGLCRLVCDIVATLACVTEASR